MRIAHIAKFSIWNINELICTSDIREAKIKNWLMFSMQSYIEKVSECISVDLFMSAVSFGSVQSLWIGGQSKPVWLNFTNYLLESHSDHAVGKQMKPIGLLLSLINPLLIAHFRLFYQTEDWELLCCKVKAKGNFEVVELANKIAET